MSKYSATLAGLLAAVMLAGCAAPGSKNSSGSDGMIDSYSYKPTDTYEDGEAYSWLVQPDIIADNIIVFDGSVVDPDNEENRSYANYAVIQQEGRYGLIDYSGKIVVKPGYEGFFLCKCGQVILYNTIDQKAGIYEYCALDKDRAVTTTPVIHSDDSPEYFYDAATEKVYVRNKGSETVAEYTGKKAVAVTEGTVTEEYGALTVTVEEGARCGMAKKGELLTGLDYASFYAPEYKGAGSTLIAFKNDEGKWGYLDADGDVIIDFTCDGDMNAYNGALFDNEDVSHPYLFDDEYTAVTINGSYCYYDKDGNLAVKLGEFGQARPVHNGRAWVKYNGMWGVIQLGELVEDEIRREDSSSQSSTTTSTMWTTTTEASTTTAAPTDTTTEAPALTPAPTTEEPQDTEPAPVDPTPVDPTPVDPTPFDPTPVDPTPVDPTPVDPTPVDPTPVDPTPAE